MPPKKIGILGAGRPRTFIETPEGLQPLYALEEPEETEPEEIQWPKENPDIKAAELAEFTAEAQTDPDIVEATMAPDVVEAFTALGGACKQFANAMGVILRAAAEYVVTMYQQATAQLSKAAEVKAALNEAPPRVRHLAEHSKKYRTRKKNINRALRDYRRRHRKRDKP
jgi:hypothetical protein